MTMADFNLSFALREPRGAKPSKLLLLLHGVGGNEANFSQIAQTLPPDWLVLMPRGPIELGPGRYAWFHVGFTPEGPRIDAQEAEASRERLVAFVSQVQAAHGIEPRATVIAGFSQGGIMSASVALSSPESVAGFAILSGRILPELEPRIAPRERLSALKAFVAHGEQDGTLPVAHATRSDALLTKLGVDHETRLLAGGHEIGPRMWSEFLAWLGRVPR
jgi:phospholipase/carboxylesterase